MKIPLRKSQCKFRFRRQDLNCEKIQSVCNNLRYPQMPCPQGWNYIKALVTTVSCPAIPCAVLSHSVMSDSETPWTAAWGLPGPSVHEDSLGKNTGVGCHALLQEIFPTHTSNPGLLHCRWILDRLSHGGSPRTLEVVYPFSRDLPDPGIEPRSPALHADSLQLSYQGSPLTIIVTIYWVVTGESESISRSIPGSSVHTISQARIMEWAAIPFSTNLPNQESNLSLPHCWQILYCLSHWIRYHAINTLSHLICSMKQKDELAIPILQTWKPRLKKFKWPAPEQHS